MPNPPVLGPTFVDDGRLDRSNVSFQGVSFVGIDQRAKSPITFSRSDFRKGRFLDCNFVRSDFARCDFTSSIFQRSKFLNCHFLSSSLICCVIENCEFESNQQFNPDFVRCRFSSCTFKDQPVERATWQDSTFDKCRFFNFHIERSTLQNIDFEDCDLGEMDLSQLSAQDLNFFRGTLAGVTFDPDYLGTYTFDQVDFRGVRFSYRSAGLDFSIINPEDILALRDHLIGQRRWSEGFNASALLAQIHPSDFVGLLEHQWERCLVGSLDLEIPSDAAENVRRLFRLAKHYSNIGLIPVSAALALIAGAEALGRLPLNPLVIEELAAGANSFRRAVETNSRLEVVLAHDPCRAIDVRFQVVLDTDDSEAAVNSFNDFFGQLTTKNGIPFEILKVSVGSVIIEAASWFVVVMMFFRAARVASYTVAEIKLITKASDRIVRIVDQLSTPADVIDGINQLRRSLPKETNVRDLVGNEVSDIGKSIRSLTHSVKVGGIDLLKLVREVRIVVNDLRKLS